MVNYLNFALWLDDLLSNGNFERVEAFNFNLYEEFINDNITTFSVQLIGAPFYNREDSDWACNEVYSSGENLFIIDDCDDWEECLKTFKKLITEFLVRSENAKYLKNKLALTYGFVDGDLEIIYDR